MNDAQPVADSEHSPPRAKRRRWPAVLFWVSVAIFFLHIILVLHFSAGLAIWFNPFLRVTLLPTGLLLLGLPVVALILAVYLAFQWRLTSPQARAWLILQVILLASLRIWLHWTPDGIYCNQLQTWAFKHDAGPKLQTWAASVLNDPSKQKVLLNEPAADFQECFGDALQKWTSIKGESSEAMSLPAWLRANRPNVVFIHHAGSKSYIAVLTSGGFGTQGFILGISVPPNVEFQHEQEVLPNVYYCVGE